MPCHISADMGNIFNHVIIKEHTLAIEAGGNLAPQTPAAGPAAAIDVEKLEDIFL